MRLPIPLLAITLPALLTSSSCAGDRPIPERELTLALSEISGLALRHLGERTELFAVGDEAHELLVVPLEGGLPAPAGAARIALPLPDTAGGSELEGVSIAPDGSVWVVAEHGEVFAFTLDGASARALWRKPIVFSPEHPLASAWAADTNRRAEGLAHFGGRVFVVKQSDPAALIELRPEADRFVAASSHPLSDMDDASDLVAGPAGLYVIGARTGRICLLAAPPSSPGAPLPCARRWPLPDTLGASKARWEGLAFLPDGRPIVAVDRKKIDRPNLAVLPALPR